MSEGERALALRVDGRVQGVGYRAFLEDEATRRGIKGWVVNREDGSVEAALRGPGQALAELVGLLRKGPPGARVDNLDVRSTDRGKVDDPPPEGYAF